MRCRKFPGSLVLLLTLATLAASFTRVSARPNVLFIVCDDLNRHVRPSGYEHIRTPTLDRLASESLVFTRAYCQYPVCGPSRASFLSGLYPESTRVLSNKIFLRETRPGTVTLPVAFHRSGYSSFSHPITATIWASTSCGERSLSSRSVHACRS